MVTFLIFFICILASTIGAICGIGGGVVIKPVLDSFNLYPIATVSFLSSCTVLSMTTYSVIRSKCSGQSQIEFQTTSVLAVGAAVGGVVGNSLFRKVQGLCVEPQQVGAVQAAMLVVVLGVVFLYTVKKEHINTLHIEHICLRLVIGVLLGIMSAFLGIGGGPLDVAFLSFFFSMDTKKAAANSLYIIFFSQLTNLLSTVLNKNVPTFPAELLALMICGGIAGGICGRTLNKKLSNQRVEFLFLCLVVAMIFLNSYNFVNLMQIH